MTYEIHWKKYLFVLIITAAIFATAFFSSRNLNQAKIEELRKIQDNIAIDLLSSEMQFTLLAESSCDDMGGGALSRELDNLGGKLSYAEENISASGGDILWLKKNYSLFEIRDYLLNKELAKKCVGKDKPFSILYFYSNDGTCADCKKQGIALTELRRRYPSVRVYSFDYHLDLSALQTLIEIHKIDGGKLPALVINRVPSYGYKSIEDITEIVPEIKAEEEEMAEKGEEKATSTAR